jgi:16S rRNA processing protein RimM
MQRAQPKPREGAGSPQPVFTSNLEAPIVVGKVVGPYGIKGWVKVVSFTDPADNLLGYRPWHFVRDGRAVQVDLEIARPQGTAFVAKIRGIDDRSNALSLANVEIAVAAAALPVLAADEFYWKDLIGMNVVAPDGARLGHVVELIETGANDVLVVDGDTGRRLIPFVESVIGAVDVAARQLVADWREPAEA